MLSNSTLSKSLALFALLGCIASTYSVRCKGGTPILGNHVTPPTFDTVCKGPYLEDLCYVMVTDYTMPSFDKEAYTYGCILKVRISLLFTVDSYYTGTFGNWIFLDVRTYLNYYAF